MAQQHGKPGGGKTAEANDGLRPSRRRPHPRSQAALDVALLATAMIAVGALLLEHGFYHLPAGISRTALLVVQAVMAAALLGERLGRCLLAENWWRWLREHWLAAALPAGAVAVAALVETVSPPWVTAMRTYLLAALSVHALQLYLRAVNSGIRATRLLVGSFLFCILVGTGLLWLPRAVPEGETLHFDQALFTATSATCVTGLIVRDTGGEFSRFGHVVILCLIQLGGLGIMICGTIFVLLGGRSLNLHHIAAVGQAINQRTLGRIARTVKFVILATLLTEGVGAALLFPLWQDKPGGVFAAVFHSVSAFCNAGFSLQQESFTLMRQQWRVMVVMPVLIVVGGIGFPVLMDVVGSVPTAIRYLRGRLAGGSVAGAPRPRWALHTKIVLTTSLLLVVFGTAGLVLVEPRPRRPRVGMARHVVPGRAHVSSHDWQTMPVGDRVAQAWFQAVSARTAGFNTINVDQLSGAGKLWMIGLMIVGGSPASTAGGMKTVTLAVLLVSMCAMLRRRPNVEAFGRTLPPALLRRAVTLGMLYALLLGATTLLLAVAQGPTARFIDVLFESVSACGTVGLSLGETTRLTLGGRCVIIAAMFVGRLGPLTLLMSLIGTGVSPRYRYPEENLVIG